MRVFGTYYRSPFITQTDAKAMKCIPGAARAELRPEVVRIKLSQHPHTAGCEGLVCPGVRRVACGVVLTMGFCTPPLPSLAGDAC